MEINKVYYTWHELEEDIVKIVSKIKESPDCLVSIGRGGMVITRLLSDYFLHAKIFYIDYSIYETGQFIIGNKLPVINTNLLDEIIKYKNIYLIDDISDTGKTLSRCKSILKNHCNRSFTNNSIYAVSLFTKRKWETNISGSILINDDWIVFPWEKNEFLKDNSNAI